MAGKSKDPLVRAFINQANQEKSRRQTPNKIPTFILELPRRKKKKKKKVK